MVKKTRYCTYMVRYHLVYITKYRARVLTKEIRDRLKEVIGKVSKDLRCELIELNGLDDHIHLVMELHPTLSISTYVRSTKAVSSRVIREEYPEVQKVLYGDKAKLWSRAYYAGTVGNVSVETVLRYVEDQTHYN